MENYMDWGTGLIVWLQQFQPELELPVHIITFAAQEVFYMLLFLFLFWCVDRRMGLRPPPALSHRSLPERACQTRGRSTPAFRGGPPRKGTHQGELLSRVSQRSHGQRNRGLGLPGVLCAKDLVLGAGRPAHDHRPGPPASTWVTTSPWTSSEGTSSVHHSRGVSQGRPPIEAWIRKKHILYHIGGAWLPAAPSLRRLSHQR